MKQRSVLVTGGAGFIGSHTCKELARRGVLPITFDDLSRGNRKSVKWGALVVGDILDTDLLAATLKRHQPEAVIHFAALAYVGESVTDPASYYSVNVTGTHSLLEACRRTGVNNVVFSSSCATYGIPDRLPIAEDAEQRPINPYGRTKLIGEHMLRDYAAAYGTRHVILRYFNAGGADPDGEIGEWHQPETHLIPRALMAAYGGIEHLSVFGNDYDTRDGTCIRDYIHVCDLARAHALAVDYLASGGANTAVNLGSGRGISVSEILRSIQGLTSVEVPIVIQPRRRGDPPALYADPSRARELLGFKAEMSDIDTIVGTASPFFASRDVT
jgi:UDP-arabinose 4-epimerase